MTSPPLAVIPGIPDTVLLYSAVGLAVFLAFVVGSRVVSAVVVEALRRRHIRTDMVRVAGRVVTFVLIGLGVRFAVGLWF